MKVYRDLNDLPTFNKSVVTIGSFDGVHQGHRKLFQKVREIASQDGYESIIITFHPHPRQIIYPNDSELRLLNTIDEKLELLEDCGIDNVVIAPFTVEFSQISPKEYIESFLIRSFNPAHIVIGYDHKFGLNRSGDIHLLRQYEKESQFCLTEIPAHEIDDISISSSKIRKALLAGDIALSNRYLTHPYPISGKIVKGEQLGRDLGFPTANIDVTLPQKLIPAAGIYACTVKLQNHLYKGMLYIGDKPTIDDNVNMSIEVNIFDFTGDVYNEDITVYLHTFVRADQKFDGLVALKEQMKKDEIKIREILSIIDEAQNPEVAIVVLNFNGLEFLESFLPPLAESYSGNDKIFVIDNNSTDDSVKYVEEWHPEIGLIQLDKNYGFAEGYNRGIEKISAPYLALVNSDVLVSEGWLDPIIKKLENNKSICCIQPKVKSLEFRDHFEYSGAAGGLMDVLNYPLCRGRIFDEIEKDTMQYDDSREIFWASGAAMVIRTDLMKKFGGFDSDFFAHQEEIDLCWRLKNAGYKIYVEPQSVIYHLGGGTLDYGNPQKLYLNFRNNYITGFKNEKLINLFWKFPCRLFLDIASILKFILSGQFTSGLAVVRALFYILVRPLLLLRKRKKNLLIIKKNRIGLTNDEGRLNSSVVWQYFILGKKTYSSMSK